MIIIVLLSGNCLAFIPYGSPPPYSHRIYRLYLLLLPVVSVVWGVPYLLSPQRTIKPFVIASGVLAAFGVMATVWEEYAWGEGVAFIVSYAWFIFMIIVNYCLIRSSENPERDRRIFTIIFLPIVIFVPLIVANDWYYHNMFSPYLSLSLSLLLTLPVSILFLGKKRNWGQKVAEVIFLVVVGCLPIHSSGQPVFADFAYFFEACHDFARHVERWIAVTG